MAYGGGKDDARTEHPTQKPVVLFETPIANHMSRGDLVFDPFLGSGTAVIASERLDRRCYGLEIDPRYADVVVERWQNFTGQKAKRKSA